MTKKTKGAIYGRNGPQKNGGNKRKMKLGDNPFTKR